MEKTVLDVGNCSRDHAAIAGMLRANFEVQVLQAHNAAETLSTLKRHSVNLVLINRKLDQDYSDGLEIIRQIKSEPLLASVPVMLVTNYDEHQQLAMSLGAVRGFGKLALDSEATRQQLAEILTSDD